MATTAPPPWEASGVRVAPRLEECGDETLAQRVADADEAAFALLYERHYQSLYRYCHSIVRDDLDAQDALQTAWTSALIALRRGRRDAPVRPWLYRIVHNEAISVLRRRRSELPAPVPASGAASAEEHVIDRERFDLLLADLRQLPERPRGALLMRELNGLSHEEIAAALETSVAAAKQCVYEARRHLADFAAGRQTPCDEICRSISDGDRRVLRGRRVMAHLRDCPGCAAFASMIDQRRGALHALTPWLAAPAAITMLDRVLRAGAGAITRAGAGAAGGSAGAVAGGSAGGAGGFAGTAGSTAVSQSAVAGGALTKALGMSLLAKGVMAAAAVTAGVLSLGGQGATPRGVSPSSPSSTAPAAAVVGARWTASSPAVRAFGAERGSRGVVARDRSGGLRRGQADQAASPLAPGQAKKVSGARAPGQAKKAGRGLPPGQAKKAAGGLPRGQAKKTAGGLPRGQAKKTSGVVPPGQAKKTTGSLVPGPAKKTPASLAPGQARKVSDGRVPGQVETASGATAPGQESTAPSAVAPHQPEKPEEAIAPGRADKTPADPAPGNSGNAPSKIGADPQPQTRP